MCVFVDLDAYVRCKHGVCLKECRDVWLCTKIVCIDPSKQMVHRRIGSHAHTIDLIFRKMDASAHLVDHRIDGLFDHRILKFLLSTRFLRLDDTIDNIRAKTDLSVSGRTLGQNLTCFHIDQDC